MKEQQTPYAEVLVVFLSSSKGGRMQMPYLNDQKYRPHFRVPPSTDMLGVEFVDGPDGAAKPEINTYATVRFVYYPQVSYNALQVGAEFEILEGGHVVGHGKITRR